MPEQVPGLELVPELVLELELVPERVPVLELVPELVLPEHSQMPASEETLSSL